MSWPTMQRAAGSSNRSAARDMTRTRAPPVVPNSVTELPSKSYSGPGSTIPSAGAEITRTSAPVEALNSVSDFP
jgi:hypothetical protein